MLTALAQSMVRTLAVILLKNLPPFPVLLPAAYFYLCAAPCPVLAQLLVVWMDQRRNRQ